MSKLQNFQLHRALLILLLSTASVLATSRPNILFIMSDDHASHAISAYGSRINQTPHLDRLAHGGMKLNNCFAVNAICTPRRASILTGKYSHLNGVTVFNRFDGSQWTVAKTSQAAGYHTALIGKWHLTTGTFFRAKGLYHYPCFIEMGERKRITGYATDIITDLTIEHLKNASRDKPFFVMSHHKAPHRAWEPSEKYARLYEDVDIPEPETFNDDYATRTPAAGEATMRIDRDLTRRDLKVVPPPNLKGPELAKWNATIDLEMEIEIKGERKKTHRRGAQEVEVSEIHQRLSSLHCFRG